MDWTEKNIKMLKKAEEIQKGHEWQDGDCYVEVGSVGLFCENCVGNRWLSRELERFKENAIWLPRQDELQEMVDWEVDDLLFMVEAIQAFASIKMTNAFPTWEQLWLAFVMKEKYNKVWDGEDWVKE